MKMPIYFSCFVIAQNQLVYVEKFCCGLVWSRSLELSFFLKHRASLLVCTLKSEADHNAFVMQQANDPKLLGLHLTGSASTYSSCGVVRLNVAVVCHSCRISPKQTNMKANVLWQKMQNNCWNSYI